VITGLVLWSLLANQQRVDDIQKTRVENLNNSCEKSNEIARSVNSLVVGVQKIILSGTLLPGDRPVPADAKGPSEWVAIVPGPLSQQIEDIAPAFPSPSERLTNSKNSAASLDDQKVALRDCEAEIATIQDPENGG